MRRAGLCGFPNRAACERQLLWTPRRLLSIEPQVCVQTRQRINASEPKLIIQTINLIWLMAIYHVMRRGKKREPPSTTWKRKVCTRNDDDGEMMCLSIRHNVLWLLIPRTQPLLWNSVCILYKYVYSFFASRVVCAMPSARIIHAYIVCVAHQDGNKFSECVHMRAPRGN